MKESQLSTLAQGTDLGTPSASILTPDVRSGSTFTYDGGGGDADSPAFLLVWFYTVAPAERATFVNAVLAYEGAAVFPQSGANPVAGVSYRGTYSVSISSAAPDFEFRTVWGLDDLGKLQELNDLLHSTSVQQLQDMLTLIAPVPAMRSEIMGLTRNSASLQGSAPTP